MTKRKFLAILVIAMGLLLVWEIVSIAATIKRLDGNLSSMETEVAPGGPIDSSINSINRSLDSIDKSLDEIQGIYTVTVDYNQTVEQLVQAGKYKWADKEVASSNFPSTESGKAQVDIYLVSFARNISSEDAIKEMSAQGLRPATLKELLVLGTAYPNLQRAGPIVALGSSWRHPDGNLDVPFLAGYGPFRYLFLVWFDGGWDSSWRLAAVRN